MGDFVIKLCEVKNEDIASAVIPDGVTEIGARTFARCKNLQSVTIPNSVTKIDELAFSECESLTDITIPSSVTQIDDNAFSCCVKLESVVLPDNMTKINDFLFSKCESLKNIVIPNGVTEIGVGAFFQCAGLTSITIPSSVTEFSCNIFEYCDRLTHVNISVEKFRLLWLKDRYLIISNFAKQYSKSKTTYTNDEINRYIGFITLFKEACFAEFNEEIMYERKYKMEKAWTPLTLQDIESVAEEHLIDIIQDEKLLSFMCFDMKNIFSREEVDLLLDLANNKTLIEQKFVLLQYKHDNFGFEQTFDDLEDWDNNLDKGVK